MVRITILRSSTPENLNDINALLPQLTASAINVSMAQYNEILSDRNTFLIAAKKGTTIVGLGILVLVRTLTGLHGIIEDVVVHEEYRGLKIGKRLCEAMIRLARKKHAKHLDLTSRKEREAANKLYQKLGFQRRDTNPYRLKLI